MSRPARFAAPARRWILRAGVARAAFAPLLRRGRIAALLLSLAGPATLAAKERPAKELESFLSWSAAFQMTGEMWLSGAAPSPYAASACEHGRQEIVKKMRDLELQAVPTDARNRVRAALEQMENAAHALGLAVKAGDRDGAAAAVREMKGDRAVIRSAIALARE